MSNENLEKENNTSLVNPTSYFIVENDELVDSSVVNNFTRGRGIKVLVVDDDVTCLSIITKYLNLYQYQVISKSNPVEALNLLEKNEEKINLLLTDVCMEDVDGFKLLEVAKKHDIPVIMMSGYNDEDIVMKGVTYGARNHLLKPIKLTDVQHIWQHVLRNNLEKGINNEDHRRDNKTIDCDSEDHRNKTSNGIIVKKSGNRVRWNDDLHRDFVSVVESLGGEDKAVPKKILEVLNGKYGYLNLTREQVASHLQKYRKNLSKHKNNNSNKGVTTSSSIMDQSFMVDQFTSPIVSHRHHLPTAPHLQNYPQLNNHPHSMINYVVGQPQPLQIRPSQMIMQPMMQFGRNNLMGSNKLTQVNYHQQQQAAQPLMNFGDLGSMLMNNSFDSDRLIPVQDEEFNASLIINPTTNIFLNDGNNHNHNWGNDFSKSS